MTDLRKLARGQACTVRFPGCRNDRETTVLAHIRRPWNAGVGRKPKDIHGVHACARCHSIMDQRLNTGLTRDQISDYLLDALMRTRDAQEDAT